MSAPLKVCPCCGAQHTHATWAALRLVGVQRDPEDGSLDFELRDCACTSTIAVMVTDLREVAA